MFVTQLISISLNIANTAKIVANIVHARSLVFAVNGKGFLLAAGKNIFLAGMIV